jgi:hypothetical protein
VATTGGLILFLGFQNPADKRARFGQKRGRPGLRPPSGTVARPARILQPVATARGRVWLSEPRTNSETVSATELPRIEAAAPIPVGTEPTAGTDRQSPSWSDGLSTAGTDR